jgi:hypothetical protein
MNQAQNKVKEKQELQSQRKLDENEISMVPANNQGANVTQESLDVDLI